MLGGAWTRLRAYARAVATAREDHRRLLVLLACMPYAMPRLPEDQLVALDHPPGRLGITRRAAPVAIPQPRPPMHPALLDLHIRRLRRRRP